LSGIIGSPPIARGPPGSGASTENEIIATETPIHARRLRSNAKPKKPKNDRISDS
jgi:hypothetical protein